jgi:iron complex outermembrane receptor protein
LPGHFQWNLGVYRSENLNDIALLSTAVNGYGYYSNIGSTRRQGIEAATSYHDTRLDLGLNYSLVQTTYRDALTISSNSPAADADGNISVQPGDHLPSTPASRVTLQAEYAIFHAWKVGADLRYTGSQYLVGDESNQEPKLPAYTVVNLHSGWQVTRHVKIFGEIDNLFDKTYYTYGTFTQLDGLPPNFSYLSDPRTYSPSPGRVAYAGARLEF